MTFPTRPPIPPGAQPPTQPPPPTVPVAPTRPVIGWGMGDVLIGLGLWLFGAIVVAIVLVATGDLTETSATDIGVGALTISVVAGWPGFLGWPIVATFWKGQRSLRRDFGLEVRPIDIGWGVLGGVVALAISIAGAVVWSLLADSAPPSNTDVLPTRPDVLTALVLIVLVAVCTPVVEELFFRGLFLRSVGRRWNLTAGVVISSLVFGLLHAQGGTWAEAGFFVFVTASYGAVFALLVVRAGGRLGPSIIAHMCVNIVGVLGTFLL